MTAHMVRVYLNPGEGSPRFATVLRSEVPAGYILAQMIGFGECYLDPRKIKLRDDPQHGEFPEPIRGVIRRVAQVLYSLRPLTAEKWEHDFRCNKHPWTEIAHFESPTVWSGSPGTSLAAMR